MSDINYFDAIASTPLLRRAVIAGGLAGICCASLSPLVVLRRMAFIGDGMAHASFGGIGLALYFLVGSQYEDVSVQLLTLGFCLVLGVAVGVVTRRADADKLAEDSAIGIAFSVSMAIGLLFIALRQRRDAQYVPKLDTYLFGNPLNISTADVLILAGVTAVVVLSLLLFYKEIQFYAFDARMAEVSGVNVTLIHYMFILLLVLTVVISSRVVSIILVSASLVIPGIIALKLSARLLHAMALAAMVGLFSFELGMYAAYALNIHPGSAIVLIQFALLILASITARFTSPTRPA